MPYINMSTNIALSKAQKDTLKARFGKAIEIIPSKNEKGLMVGFDDEKALYYHGDGETPCAIVEVKIKGTSELPYFRDFAVEVMKIVGEETAVDPNDVYVRFDETKYWGSHGVLTL